MANILVVEDDCDVGSMLEQLLLMDGHQARVAHNGEEGMQQIYKDKPDVAILDIEMPVLSGPGMVLRLFAEDCGIEEIPVILMSGHVDLDDIARRLGTPYKIAKPFEVKELLSLVKQAAREKIYPHPKAAGD